RRPEPLADGSPVLRAHARRLIPLLLVVAGYLLWRGTDAPGGAFQAGAMLGAASVLQAISGLPGPRLPPSAARWAAAVGLLLFLGAASATAAAGRPWLGWPVDGAKAWILLVETGAA